MTATAFEAYGDLARIGTDPLLQAGRMPHQAHAERLILSDVVTKLAIGPPARLLEIGCGPGNLLIPLSFMVQSATGLDHPDVIARARQRVSAAHLTWIGGAFPQTVPLGPFDAVLVYSVVHYLRDIREILQFAEAAATLLAPGGRLLLGDIPNASRKRRFLASAAGKAFDAAWRQAAEAETGQQPATLSMPAGAACIGALDDAMLAALFSHFRECGFHSHILPQPPDLPFGHTREDLLIVRP